MGVSINGCTPKWMVYNGKSDKNWWFGGNPISGNLHMKLAIDISSTSPFLHFRIQNKLRSQPIASCGKRRSGRTVLGSGLEFFQQRWGLDEGCEPMSVYPTYNCWLMVSNMMFIGIHYIWDNDPSWFSHIFQIGASDGVLSDFLWLWSICKLGRTSEWWLMVHTRPLTNPML